MAKVLLEEGKRRSWKVTRHALMSVAAAISLLAAVPAPGSAQTSSPCDDTDVVGKAKAWTRCEPTAAHFGPSTTGSATPVR